MRHFEINESGYHRGAIQILQSWVSGVTELPYYIEGSIAFVPDLTCFKNGIIDCIYEVVYSHPLTGRKYGMIEYYCYLNAIDLSIYEISADFILKQTSKPDRIELMECYIIDYNSY